MKLILVKAIKVKKPLTEKQKKALEIGAALRVLTGCKCNLSRLKYASSAVYSNRRISNLVGDAILKLAETIDLMREYNLEVVKHNKQEKAKDGNHE